MAEFPDTEVIIHPEPEGLMDQEGIAAEELLPVEVRT
jgi:ferrous-iron efflux pump FieF